MPNMITYSAREIPNRKIAEAVAKSARRLCSASLKTQGMAYQPYSKFRVGCALLGANGRIYCGCNVENANYICIHSEANAVSTMVTDGCRSILAYVCVGSLDGQEP